MDFNEITRFSFEQEAGEYLDEFPVVAILGPRQCGKTTFAQHILSTIDNPAYLDLELPSDRRNLADPELFFQQNRGRLICLDEIQMMPEIFRVLRGTVDKARKNAGQFLILGSASRDLIRQSSESLAGRIAYLELTPFTWTESKNAGITFDQYCIRGGFPLSILAKSDRSSMNWRKQFIRTFLERDIPQLGFTIPAANLNRLWQMIAHQHGELMNLSRFGGSLGISHTTTRNHLEILEQTFVIRILKPLLANRGKRLVKAPKVYIRDAGLLHALLDIPDMDALFAHPVFGTSFEGTVIENLIQAMPDWEPSFYRTATGVEIDLVLQKGKRRLAFECKNTSAPDPGKGFWIALDDLKPEKTFVVSKVDSLFPLKKNVWAGDLDAVLGKLPD